MTLRERLGLDKPTPKDDRPEWLRRGAPAKEIAR